MKTITLTRGKISTYDDKTPFLVENGALEVKFVLPSKTGEYYLVTDNNGKQKTFIPQDGQVSLSVTEGVLSATVKRYVNGRMTEQYPIEPLEIRSVNDEVSAFPELSVLQKSVDDAKASYAEKKDELEEKEKSLDAALQEVKENAEKAVHRLAVAFLSFAYAEYKTDIQMNARDLSAEDFLAAFGFSASDFTEDELNEIKKEKDL